MRLNQLSKHFCHSDWGNSKTCIPNLSTAFSGYEKRWPFILFFTYGNKKKSFGAKSGLYGGCPIKSMFWVFKNAVVWADLWKLAFSWWRVICLLRLVFLISWQTNDCVPLWTWLFCVVLVVRLQYVQFFRKKRQSLVWKCFLVEELLDIIHITVSKHCDRIFEAFLSTPQHGACFEWLTYCVKSNASKFFCKSNVHAILNVCWFH